jgi:glycerophosphoryl diester phosphodiesterase
MSDRPPVPGLVAHRGYPQCYPENSLAGFRAALEAGACYLETDVQLSADRVPFLSHDDTLGRVSESRGRVTRLTAEQLLRVDAGEPARLGKRFRATRLTRLAELAALLRAWPAATLFVELKRQSLRRFGVETVLGSVLECLGHPQSQWVLISFDWPALAAARRAGCGRIGWVLPRWNATAEARAHGLGPEFLFCSQRLLGTRLPWPGPWRWVVYTVDRAETALALAARGMTLIETNAIGTLLSDPRLRQRGDVGQNGLAEITGQ